MAPNTDRKVDGSEYNKTQLAVHKARARMIVHRDYDAHMNRFAHVLKQIKVNKPQVVLDVGSGDKQLAMCFYANKSSKGVTHYHSVDLRDATMPELAKCDPPPFPMTHHTCDVTKSLPSVDPDIVTCFEVIEHVPKDAGIRMLEALKAAMAEKSTLYLSTPCYSEAKGQAGNHIYEWEYQELKDELEKHFEIVDHWGTFQDTGIGDNKKFLENYFGAKDWARLKDFYHSSILSNLFAPLFPERSRNCMWKLKKKKLPLIDLSRATEAADSSSGTPSSTDQDQ